MRRIPGAGVVFRPGFEIVYVTFQARRRFARASKRMEEFLESAGQSKEALCGVSLRSPRPYSFQGFVDFNSQYAEILKSWGVFVKGVNPIARTNVAPVINPPAEPVLYGFSFTRPCSAELPSTFVVCRVLANCPKGSCRGKESWFPVTPPSLASP